MVSTVPSTPDNDSAEDAEEAFCTKMSRVENEEALNWARLDSWPVKEGEEWNTDEKARAVTIPLVEDTPCIESRLAPHNMLHTHTPVTSKAASMQCLPAIISGTPGIPEPEDHGMDWDPLLHDMLPPDEAMEPLTQQLPKQIRPPTNVGEPLELLWGEASWYTIG